MSKQAFHEELATGSANGLVCMFERDMTKRIDFARVRRLQGRSLRSTVQEIADLVQPLAVEQGVDFRTRLAEGRAQRAEEKRLLAERLQESVVPLFIANGRGPERIGSCVLVRFDSKFFAFTAAHVVRDAGPARLLAPSKGTGGKLLPLPPLYSPPEIVGR
jgi:hypothetical protein